MVETPEPTQTPPPTETKGGSHKFIYAIGGIVIGGVIAYLYIKYGKLTLRVSKQPTMVTGTDTITFDLSWNSLEGAQSYNIKSYTKDGQLVETKSFDIKDLKQNGNELTATINTGFGENKYYEVTSVKSNTESFPSQRILVITKIDAPSLVLMSSTSGIIELSWNATAGKYIVKRTNPNGSITEITRTNSYYTDKLTATSAKGDYKYVIQAVNDNGLRSPPSNSGTITFNGIAPPPVLP